MNQSPLRIVFAGTPEFAAAHLRALLAWEGGDVIGVYSQPDRPAGRGKKLAMSPVKELALAQGLPVYQPLSLRTPEAQAELRAQQADIMVVVAYGLILPSAALAIPRLGCINVHASILPRWRGAAPIQRAIAAGDTETGVTIMQMDAGLDTGAMLNSVRCAIAADETSASLHARLAAIGAPALTATLEQLAARQTHPVAQDDTLTCYAAKISREEAALDWRKNAISLDRQIRAFNPAPVAHAAISGERIKIYRAQPETKAGVNVGEIISADKNGIVVGCGFDSCLRIIQLQLPGGKVLSVGEVLNGRSDLFAPGRYFDPVDCVDA